MYVIYALQGDEVPLTALLVIYQLHAPHLIPITLKSQHKVYNIVIVFLYVYDMDYLEVV